MESWKLCGRRQLWFVLRYEYSDHLKQVRESIKNLRLDSCFQAKNLSRICQIQCRSTVCPFSTFWYQKEVRNLMLYLIVWHFQAVAFELLPDDILRFILKQ
jgi:hypothetical protein